MKLAVLLETLNTLIIDHTLSQKNPPSSELKTNKTKKQVQKDQRAVEERAKNCSTFVAECIKNKARGKWHRAEAQEWWSFCKHWSCNKQDEEREKKKVSPISYHRHLITT